MNEMVLLSSYEWNKIIGIPLGTVIITRPWKIWGIEPLTKGVILKALRIGTENYYLIQFEQINHGVVCLWLKFGADFKVVDS
jgi:hypothetical protein